MKRIIWLAVMIGTLALAPLLTAQTTTPTPSPTTGTSEDASRRERDRLQNAATVLQEILNIPEGIPQELLAKARCVIVMPSVLKAAFVVGGSYGRGAMICRMGAGFTGAWGATTMVALEGGSVGLQIGGEATDFVFLVMGNRGADSLMHSKVKLGGDVSIAAGPVGRAASADTDATLRSEILSYSRASGVFSGVSLEGSTLGPDNDANRDLYGRAVNAADIINGQEVLPPPAAQPLIALLQQASPRLGVAGAAGN